ncbi:DUF2508 family protein [Desulfofalx alkaliphila]|uniref:DUF2508 family protein n=1 Tax=Desulfofalx alkaliphila TaxID=105483 RepID=UPI0004E25990|nr:DUF2508 family protein [Desulfofalx alkaliphila]
MIGSLLRQLREVMEFLNRLMGRQEEGPELFAMIEQAHLDWQHAMQQLDLCDKDMLDYVIHQLQARERRYIALMMQARQEGLVAWTPDEN